jgi:hypothetical protein
MSATIFFSWQSDRPKQEGRNFIEKCLRAAVTNLALNIEFQEAFRGEIEVDADTKKVPGSPKIFPTILKKIERATIFVPDFTFVANRPNGHPTPNPNVLIEYGYALKCVNEYQIMPVMNVKYGEPNRETMPFDLIEHRIPITYNLPEHADDATRTIQRTQLTKTFESALKTFFESGEYKDSLPKSIPIAYREPKNGRARFRAKGEAIGFTRGQLAMLTGQQATPVLLNDEPAMWLRVAPRTPVNTLLKISELAENAVSLITLPFLDSASGNTSVRDKDGVGYFKLVDSDTASFVTFAFRDGEIWSINAWHMARLPNVIPLDETKYLRSLAQCAEFLTKIKIPGPYRWIAGIEGARGRYLKLQNDVMARTLGPCMENVIEIEGFFSIGDDPKVKLETFFEEIYDQCGATRPPISTAGVG